ncbi:unnamed protein product [Rhizophagus irregularis]|nr:unnamed protein product [Rhizophagus irregularis]
MSNYSSLSRVLSPFRVQTKIEENSLPARSNVIPIRYTMAYYLVLGEAPAKRKLDFVEFDFSARVMILRHAIYDKKKNTFSSKSIDENDLILWKIDIPFDDENDKLTMLDETFDTINIEQDLEGKEMLPGNEISKYLKNLDKPTSSIHILVQPPKPATTGPSQQSVPQVDEIFKNFLKSEHGKFLEAYLKKNDSLPLYNSPITLKTTVPRINGRPCLLLYNLPGGSNMNQPITQISSIRSAIKNAKNNLLVLLGTSGSGKTRTCYELLCEDWGLYFIGARKGNGGSGDIEAIESYLWKYNKLTDNFEDNRRHADHVVRCIVLSRLLILNECITKSPTFNPQRWLLLQAYQNIFGSRYNYTDDLFQVLSFMLTDCTQSSLEDHIDTIYKKISGSNVFPIVFDEAQSLQTVLNGKFRSRYNKEEERSLLSPIVQTLKKPTLLFSNHCVIPCGTGLGLLALDEVLASTGIAKPDLNIDRFTEFGRWRDIHHVKDYCSELIDLAEEEYELIYEHFRGRFRPIVTCLEEIIMANGFSRNWFWVSHGNNPPTISELNRNTGLGENIPYESSVNEDLLSPARVGEKSLVAYVDEPFAIVAGRNYFNDNKYLSNDILMMMSKVSDASACGTLWQKYLPEELERIFNGENDISDMPMFADASENGKLPSFCKGSPKIVKSPGIAPRVATTPYYTLDKFFDESYENSRPTFLIPDNHCGPDIIFFVKFEKVTVPVFVQIKLRYSLHTIAGALSTIRPELFYQNKNE